MGGLERVGGSYGTGMTGWLMRSSRSRHSYKAPTLQLQAAAAERGVPYAAFRTDCTSSAVAEVMFQMVAAVLQAMEGLVPDFPVCASGGGDARDVVASDLEVGE